MIKCPICGRIDAECNEYMNEMKERYSCKNCTEFSIPCYDAEDPEFLKILLENKAVLSGVCRHNYEDGQDIVSVSRITITDLLKSKYIPVDLTSKVEHLLVHMEKKSRNSFFRFTVDENIFPSVAYLKDKNELTKMFEVLSAEDFVKFDPISASGHMHYTLTMKGIEKAKSIRSNKTESVQAFIAMWFDSSLDEAHIDAFESAIKLCGYTPKRIDKAYFNNDICEEIISSIRSSRFIIADFTGDRGGVYFEAGFASGFGIPVIYTCNKDWFDAQREDVVEVITEKGDVVSGIYRHRVKVHFDVDHNSFIRWDNIEELRKDLIDRITATIGRIDS